MTDPARKYAPGHDGVSALRTRLAEAEGLLERTMPEIYGTAMGGPKEHAENKALLADIRAFLARRKEE